MEPQEQTRGDSLLDQLRKLNEAINQKEDNLKNAQGALLVDKDNQKVLQGLVDTIEKIVGDYGAVQGKLKDQLADFSGYVKHEEDCYDKLHPGTKDKVEEILKAVDGEIATLKTKVDDLQKELPKAESEATAAESAAAKSSEEFETLKKHQKAVEDVLKTLDSGRKQVAKSEQEGNRRVAYFSLTGLRKTLDAMPKVVTASELQSQLETKWTELKGKQETAGQKRAYFEQKKAELKRTSADLAQKEKDREKTVLEQIKKLK